MKSNGRGDIGEAFSTIHFYRHAIINITDVTPISLSNIFPGHSYLRAKSSELGIKTSP
jgi:hypothetical protein